MDHKLQKILPAFAVSLVALTSSVNAAADDMQVRNLENRVSALEQRRGANGMINPPSRPVVKDGSDLWLQGEALFMQAAEDGLNYVVKSDNTVTFVDGRAKSAKYDWSWGFRLGGGYNAPHDGWDFAANWTRFYSSHNTHTNSDALKNLIATIIAPSVTDANTNFGHANSKVHLHMNLIDLEMGREFFASKWLMLRPHVGFRGAWLTRKFDSSFSGGALTAGQEIEVEMKNRFRGFGLRAGMDTQWGLGSGWSIFGQLAASLIYGKQHLNQEIDNESVGGTVELFDPRMQWTATRAMVDMALGLRWDHLFYDDMYRIRLQAGWEQHMYFGFTKDQAFVDDVARGTNLNRSGDLSLSGVAFQARFDF